MTRITRRTRGFALSLAALAAGAAVAGVPGRGHRRRPRGLTASGSTPSELHPLLRLRRDAPDADDDHHRVRRRRRRSRGRRSRPASASRRIARDRRPRTSASRRCRPAASRASTPRCRSRSVRPTPRRRDLGAVLTGTPSALGLVQRAHHRPVPLRGPRVGARGRRLRRSGCGRRTAPSRPGRRPSPPPTSRATRPRWAVPAFNFDNVPPVLGAGVPLTPSSGAIVPEEPTFQWNPGQDAHLGGRLLRAPDQDRRPGERHAADHDDRPRDRHRRRRQLLRHPRRDAAARTRCPRASRSTWRVRTFDKAGNVRTSDWWSIRIDSTIPPAPSITGGPDRADARHLADLHLGGHAADLQAGTSAGRAPRPPCARAPAPTPRRRSPRCRTATTSSASPRSPRRAGGAPRRPAPSRSTRPRPTRPTILSRPTFPAITAPVFTWSAEPGAYSRWVVIGADGARRRRADRHPGDHARSCRRWPTAPTASRCSRSTRPATSRPPRASRFTVLAPLVPAPSPSTARGHDRRAGAAQAERLAPAAQGRHGPADARRPCSSGRRGPRGTKLYNLQIFQVTQAKKAGASPKVTKMLSSFPRGLQIRAAEEEAQGGHLLRLARLAVHRPGLHPQAGGREQLLRRQLQGDLRKKKQARRQQAARARRRASR